MQMHSTIENEMDKWTDLYVAELTLMRKSFPYTDDRESELIPIGSSTDMQLSGQYNAIVWSHLSSLV